MQRRDHVGGAGPARRRGPRRLALAVCGLIGSAYANAAAQNPVQPGQLPPLPLVQLDERRYVGDLDNRTFTLTFSQPVALKDLLLLLVRGTSLSVVPDPAITGSFIGELKNVTVRQALGLILPPFGLDYGVDGGFIRVFRREPETRLFEINVAAVERSSAASIGGADLSGRSSASISTVVRSDAFGELAAGVRALVSERASVSVDRKAGLLQVTDFPERLDRVGIYLDAAQDRLQRQAQIDARVVEVELTDEKAQGLDWGAVAAELGRDRTPAERARPALTGMRVTDVGRLMASMALQGTVSTVATPRLFALNNEPALVRSDSLVFSVTPQIGRDSVVTLSLSPIVNAPAVAQADMIARVADGETLVVGGFTRDREVRERKHVGFAGGWFGRSTVVIHKKVELVILLTPKIVAGGTG
jgi:type II secretory pathway component HofQ